MAGKSEFTAAEIAVPFPLRTPVTVVERVIAGVVVAVTTVPARPFAVVTDTEVTVPVPDALFVRSLPVAESIVRGNVFVASVLDTPPATGIWFPSLRNSVIYL